MNKLSIAALCAVMYWPVPNLMAAVPPNKHPAKAAPAAPRTQTAMVAKGPSDALVTTLPKKPPVTTAVAPRPLVPGAGPRGIIFVGGKNQSNLHTPLAPQAAKEFHREVRIKP